MKKTAPFLLCIFISFLCSFFYIKYNEIKIGYVNASKLFNEYKMTDELKSELDKIESDKKNRLDSLAQVINVYELSKNKETSILENLKKQYYLNNEKYSADLNQLKDNFTSKIWKHINEHAINYGKENKFQIIFGANGQGTIMYAEDIYDLTEDLIKYANETYSGAK